MTLYSIVDNIKNIALSQPNVRTAEEGDVYDLSSNPTVKYGVVYLTQGQHISSSAKTDYSITIFYIDRLLDDMSNRLEIQSHGMRVIDNIVLGLEDEYDVEIGNVNYQPFTQRFADECAGVFATLTITAFKDYDCYE